MNTVLEKDFSHAFEMPSIDVLLSNPEIVNLLNDEKNKKNPYDINFKIMLDVAASVHKEMQEIVDNMDCSKSSAVFAYLNRKPKSFQKNIVEQIIARYFNALPNNKKPESGIKNKLKKIELISINVAFKAVSGHTYTSFLNVLKSIVYNKYGRSTLKAVNYLRLSNLVIKDNITYTLSLDACPDTVEKVKNENEALFYPAFYLLGFKGLNQYKDLKDFLMKKGLTTKGWKTMCGQSKSYNLRAMRKIKTGIFALNYGLKDAWLRNPFISEWVKSDSLMNRVDILLREMDLYNGPVNKFAPFPLQQRRPYDMDEIRCVQLQEIADFLTAHPNDKTKSLVHLYNKTQQWHLELRKIKRSPLAKFTEENVKVFIDEQKEKIDGKNVQNTFVFKQIEDSWLLQDEGDEMHHCVSSYAERCKRNDYLVYTVNTEEGATTQERATLGISKCQMKSIAEYKEIDGIDNIFKYTFNQMYSYCNRSVSESMHKSAKKLLKELNKPYNEKILEIQKKNKTV